jgi:hypothetical protein
MMKTESMIKSLVMETFTFCCMNTHQHGPYHPASKEFGRIQSINADGKRDKVSQLPQSVSNWHTKQSQRGFSNFEFKISNGGIRLLTAPPRYLGGYESRVRTAAMAEPSRSSQA